MMQEESIEEVISPSDLKVRDLLMWKIQNVVRKFIARCRVQKLRQQQEKWITDEMPKLYHAHELRASRRQKWSIDGGLCYSGVVDGAVLISTVPDKIEKSFYHEERLFDYIHDMVQSMKVIGGSKEKNQYIPFDVIGIRKTLLNWSRQLPFGDLRSTVVKVSKKINYGHLLLQPLNLIPLVGINKLAVLTLRTSLKRRIHSVKHADTRINSTHSLFIKIHKLRNYLQVINNLSLYRHKHEVEVIGLSQSIDTKQTMHAKELAFLYEKLSHFSEVLIKYYDGYVQDIVREYGVDSTYRKAYCNSSNGNNNNNNNSNTNINNNSNNNNNRKKNDDDANDQYLFDFGALINQNKPLQNYGLYLYMNDSNLNQLDICVDFPLKPNPNYIKNHVEQFGDMYFRYMPSNCGLDYVLNTMNFLMMMMGSSGDSHDGDDTVVNAQCLLRLEGKDTDVKE